MGITMGSVRTMDSYGLLKSGQRLLDFGSSNLYSADAAEIVDFVKLHNPEHARDLPDLAERLSCGSSNDDQGTPRNQSFVGELLEAAGMHYDAIDIAIGYKTKVVDLNTSKLPKDMIGAYDTVINFGTSEHILNQMNVFASVHDATKLGGLIMHQVPSVGYVDHGYYCYTSRFFFDLAGYNNYEVVDMWFGVAGCSENVYASARQYKTFFPVLNKRLDSIGTATSETAIDAIGIPTISLTIIYRKTQDRPFMGTVETSTSVGDVPLEVVQGYQPNVAAATQEGDAISLNAVGRRLDRIESNIEAITDSLRRLVEAKR